MPDSILFYHQDNPYGCFSNFSRHPVSIYGHTWMTSEHPFQALKFHPHRPDLVEQVRLTESPGKAAKMARDRSLPLRKDWDEAPTTPIPSLLQPDDLVNRSGVKAEPLFARVKDVIMYEVVLAKFTQNKDIQEILLSTGDAVLIEDAEFDPYWGWGCSKNGENKLGRILMAARSVILQAQS